jgi:hypothetical protein
MNNLLNGRRPLFFQYFITKNLCFKYTMFINLDTILMNWLLCMVNLQSIVLEIVRELGKYLQKDSKKLGILQPILVQKAKQQIKV